MKTLSFKTRQQLIDELASLRQNYDALNDLLRTNRSTENDLQRNHQKAITDLEDKYQRQIDKMKHDHNLEIGQKDFDMKTRKDEDVLSLEQQKVDLAKKVAVLEKELEVTKPLMDINGDILDIKSIMEKLIDKLPEMKLNSLTIQTDGKSNKSKSE